MKRTLPLLRSVAWLSLLGPLTALSQTPVRDTPPPTPVDTPQLFIPGQSPVPAAGTVPDATQPPALTAQEQASQSNFLSALDSAVQRELRVAKLAAAHSTNPAVKAMAEAIIKENMAAVKDLSNVRASLGIRDVEAVNAGPALDTRLNSMTGADFDNAILRELQRARASKIARFDATRQYAANGELKAFANNALPLFKADEQRVSPAPAENPANPGTLPSAIPGTLPSATPGTLENPVAGTLPSAIPGNLPNPAGGTLPSATPGTLPSAIPGNPSAFSGPLPSATPGTLPNAIPGTLPPVGNPLPSATPGTLPSATPGSLSNPATGTSPRIPIPANTRSTTPPAAPTPPPSSPSPDPPPPPQ